MRFQMRATTPHAILGYRDRIGRVKGHQLRTHLDAQPREVIPHSVRPFDVRVLERGVLLEALQVPLDVVDVPTHGRVDALLGDDDAPLHVGALGKVLLPQLDCLGIGQGGEDIEQHNFRQGHTHQFK